MTKYATVLNADDSIIKIESFPDNFDPANVDHKFGALLEKRMIPVVKLADAPFDSATQRLVNKQLVEATRVTQQRVAQNLTAEELASNAALAEVDAHRAFVKTAYTAMKSGSNPTLDQQRKINLFLLGQLGVTE